MPEPQALADRAAELARAATDEMRALAGPDGAAALKAASLLGDVIAMRDAARRASWERQVVSALLLAAKAALDEANPEPESPDVRDQRAYFEARDALRGGDLETARQTLEHLRSVASRTSPDDWNHGNVTHHVHVLSGLLHLRDGDVDAAAEDLGHAGHVRPTPQLTSFGPDLTLAWALLQRGRDDDVLAYLRAVSAFWSPQAFV